MQIREREKAKRDLLPASWETVEREEREGVRRLFKQLLWMGAWDL